MKEDGYNGKIFTPYHFGKEILPLKVSDILRKRLYSSSYSSRWKDRYRAIVFKDREYFVPGIQISS
jgi:hypothetical protein